MKKLYSILFFLLIVSLSFSQVAIDSGYARVNNTSLYYETAGQGQALLLVHGSFGDRRFWDPQFRLLSGKFKVIRYDIRGYGKSALPDSNEVYRDCDDMKALMDYLGISTAHICGLSLGSIIGIDFALAYPDKCSSLILCGPRVAGDATDEYHSASSDSIRAIIAKTTQLARTKGAKEATDYLWAGDHAMGRTLIDTSTRRKMLQMGYEYSWWRYKYSSKRQQAYPLAIKKLNEIKIPTLVVTSDHDLQLCSEIAEVIKERVPSAKLISIKRAGHIMNMDQPADFNKVVTEFINGLK